ncbi:MAG: VanZ family protein [Campylobacterota bacterium]|nr:VanZ family protein [Campylobacterota bacterium]
MISVQVRWVSPLIFFIFISYIIFLANTADHNFAFKLIGHVPYGDKIAHAILYGMMALLLNYGLGFRKVRLTAHLLKSFPKTIDALANAPYTGSIIVLAFATIEELSQYYIPSRTFDMGDLLADFVGVVLFSFIKILR